MLTTLFGDLDPAAGGNDPDSRVANAAEPGAGARADFAATAILESTATELSDRGHLVDKHTRELFVAGSAAEAIREHFAASRPETDGSWRQITLYDPARMWAPSVVKALSDASGQPIERLHLRRQATLANIAVIERTALPRREEDPLKIYHADVRQATRDAQLIPFALMERSQLTAVIVAPMTEATLDIMLGALSAAAHGPHWYCGSLLFMLSASVANFAPRIAGMRWPRRLNVMVTAEPMTSTSSVWNGVLNNWNRVKALPPWDSEEAAVSWPAAQADAETAASSGDAAPAGRIVTYAPAAATPLPEVEEMRATSVVVDSLRASIDATRVMRIIDQLMQIEGLLGCCVVDAETGLVMGQERIGDEEINLELIAASNTEVLKAHRRASRDMGCGDRIDEVIVTQGRRHQVLRTVASHPDLFVLAVLDKQRTNLALARFKIMDAEKALG